MAKKPATVEKQQLQEVRELLSDEQLETEIDHWLEAQGFSAERRKEWLEVTRGMAHVEAEGAVLEAKLIEHRKLKDLARRLNGQDNPNPRLVIWNNLIATYKMQPDQLRSLTIAEMGTYIDAGEFAKKQGPVKIPITIDSTRVVADGKFVPLDCTPEKLTDILHYLGQLILNCGQWVSGPEISKANSNVYGKAYRWDRILKSLPPSIKQHIETNIRKGNRLKPLDVD